MSDPATGDVEQEGELRLVSPAFDDDDPIPEKYGYEAENIHPPLTAVDVPDDAESLVLIVDDPDAREPAGQVWDHWLVWNVDPDTEEIVESEVPDGAVEGRNDFGETGYGGPNPPDREHTYRFKLYALDATLDLDAGATKDELGDAMDGRVLARTQLTGTYAP